MKPQSRTIRSKTDAKHLIAYIGNASEFPFVVDIKSGEQKRSTQQNRLQRLWCKEAGEQGDMSAEEYRGYCKLHFGVPILRMEDEEFKGIYDSVIRPLPYENKLKLMTVPIDLPVTSRMGVKQKTRYLDAMHQHFISLGFLLTDPSLLGMDDWRR